jgi:cation diffusion facilitator CzcD-associated flavoprotein CzcO
MTAAAQPRVLIIGAGMSGLLMGIRLLQSGNTNFRIFEKAPKAGGTWRENTYPNLACDVFAVAYTYSFEPNADWNYRFARGDEIQKYFERCERKYGLAPFISYSTAVTEARWEKDHWEILTASGERDRGDVLVSAAGALHHPNYPDIPGLREFAGPCFHTARWDHTVDLRGKRVGVIGTGSTASQVVPGIVDKVAEVHLFQRTPQWVMPTPDRKVSQAERARRHRFPWLLRLQHRLGLFLMEIFSRGVLGNRLLLRYLEAGCRANLRAIRDPELRRKLTPDYPAACKRLVISEDFAAAIQRDNAHLVTERIERIEPGGVRTGDGHLHELDVLVLATGFAPYKLDFEVIGAGGRRLAERMAGSPLMYRTVGVPGFPNYFVLFGPYSPIGNMSIIENSEVQANYVLQCIELIGRGVLRSMNPREDVALALKEDMRRQIRNTVWAGGCNSWYLDDNGEAVVYPFQYAHFRRELRAPLLADFETT